MTSLSFEQLGQDHKNKLTLSGLFSQNSLDNFQQQGVWYSVSLFTSPQKYEGNVSIWTDRPE